MQNIYEILARAAALRDETQLNSISPERAGGIMYDTLLALNDLWLQQGAALVISKIYASVAAMEADTAPVSDLTGQPLRPGQIVVIASSDSDNGSVYRYNGTESPSWSLVGEIGNLEPVDSLDSDSTQLPLAAHQGKVLDGKISQLGQEIYHLNLQGVYTNLVGQYRQYNYEIIYEDSTRNCVVSSIIRCFPGQIVKIETSLKPTSGNLVVWFFDGEGTQVGYVDKGYFPYAEFIIIPQNCQYFAFEVFYNSSSGTLAFDTTNIVATIIEPIGNNNTIHWNVCDKATISGNDIVFSTDYMAHFTDLISCKYGDIFDVCMGNGIYNLYDAELNRIGGAIISVKYGHVKIENINVKYIQFIANYRTNLPNYTIESNTKFAPVVRFAHASQPVKSLLAVFNPVTKFLDRNINFNSETIYTGGYLDEYGSVIGDPDGKYTGFIDLQEHPNIFCSVHSLYAVRAFCFFDENKNLICSADANTNFVGVISYEKIKEFDPNIRYVRLSSFGSPLSISYSVIDNPITEIEYSEELSQYQDVNDETRSDGSTTSILTNFINVVPGDIYLYKGAGQYAVASALFYKNDGTFLSASQAVSIDAFTEITIPGNAYFVRFQSFRYPDNRGFLVLDVASSIVAPNKTKEMDCLYGKIYYALGDSFTHGDWNHSSEYDFPDNTNGFDPRIFDYRRGMFKTYPWQIMNRNQMSKDCKNLATNGRRITNIVSAEDYKVPENCDYVTIMIGLNDYTGGLPVGTISDTTSATFLGCWNIIFDWLTTNRIGVHIGVLIVSSYLSPEFRTATEQACEKYGIPYLNMYTDKKFSDFMGKENMDATVANRVTNAFKVKTLPGYSNGHPSLEAHKFISYGVENFLREI